MNTIKFFLIVTVAFLFLNHSAMSQDYIILPDPDMLGITIDQCKIKFINAPYNKKTIHPAQILFDINSNKEISGIIAKYNTEDVSFGDVEQALNSIYIKWKLEGFQNTPLRLWRVEKKRFAINLSLDEENDIQIIFLTFVGFKKRCTNSENL
jgi:hypothetical protein